MKVKRGYAKIIGLGLLASCLALVWSCASSEKHEGLYVAVKKDARQKEISLQLKPNGEGFWVVGDKEVAFSWYVKHGDLRINDKAGGVLVGKFVNGHIMINFPERGEMIFEKTQ